MKIAPPQDDMHVVLCAAGAEPVARGDRRVSRCSSFVCVSFGVCSVWKIHSCYDLFRQKPSVYLPKMYGVYFWLVYDLFYMYHKVIPYLYVDSSTTSSYHSLSRDLLLFLL